MNWLPQGGSGTCMLLRLFPASGATPKTKGKVDIAGVACQARTDAVWGADQGRTGAWASARDAAPRAAAQSPAEARRPACPAAGRTRAAAGACARAAAACRLALRAASRSRSSSEAAVAGAPARPAQANEVMRLLRILHCCVHGETKGDRVGVFALREYNFWLQPCTVWVNWALSTMPSTPDTLCGNLTSSIAAGMPESGLCFGPAAKRVWGRFAAAWRVRCCSASSLSAGVPWRTLLLSFLKAYVTDMGLRNRHR